MSIRVSRPKGRSWRKKMVAALIERDGPVCFECGCQERKSYRAMGQSAGEQWGAEIWERVQFSFAYLVSNLEVEHRIPLSQGGDNSLSNLQLLCVTCHKQKTTAERSARLKALFAAARHD